MRLKLVVSGVTRIFVSFKVQKMAFKLILVLAMGLGAMYMMHLLAQDYDKIRQPVGLAARALTSASATLARGKRSTNFNDSKLRQQGNIQHQQRNQRQAEEISSLQQNITLSIDWKRILSRDPFECLQSLICQIMSGAEGKSKEAILLMDFLEATLSMAPAKIGRAFSRGLALRGFTERCYDEYPFCLYSAKTMLRVLQWFTKDVA